jgi:hypothetical protein
MQKDLKGDPQKYNKKPSWQPGAGISYQPKKVKNEK